VKPCSCVSFLINSTLQLLLAFINCNWDYDLSGRILKQYIEEFGSKHRTLDGPEMHS